jgi:hypothetical protein
VVVAGFGGDGGAGPGAGLVDTGLLERKIDEEGLADDGVAGDEAPVAAVLAVVAVIAEDEIVVGGDDELAVVDQIAHLDPPDGVDVGIGVLEAREVVAEVVGLAGAIDGVGFGDGLAVDVDAACAEADAVSGEADDSLDQMEGGVDGVVEDDDIATADGGDGKEAACAVEGSGLLVYEEEVANEEGRLHGLGGDAEGLHAEGDDEDGDDDDGEHRLEGGKEAGFVVVVGVVMGVRWGWGREAGVRLIAWGGLGCCGGAE